MKISNSLNILSQIINLFLFLYLSINSIVKGNLELIEEIILAYGLFSGLLISIIAQIENLKGY